MIIHKIMAKIHKTMSKFYTIVYRMTSNNYRMWIEYKLTCADFFTSPDDYAGFSILYGIGVGVIAFLAAFLFDFSIYISIVLGIFACAVFEAIMHAIPLMVADSRAKFTEEILPDALRLISSNIRSGLTPDKAFLLSARPEFGPLEKQIRDSAKLTLSGLSIEESIKNIPKKIDSKALRRSIDLLVEGMSRGGNLANLLDGLANDIRQTRILRKEVHSIVMMYAIFIFFAAGIGAPLLYGISSFLVQTMQEMGGKVEIQETFTGGMKFMTFQAVEITQEFLMYYISISLAITSFFGGLLVGLIQEGKEKAGLRYIPILLIISLSVFFLTRIMVVRIFGAIA